MRSVLPFALLAACGTDCRPEPAAVPPPAPRLDPRFIGAIVSAATSYTRWGKVDPRLAVAPIPCAAGDMAGRVERVRMSSAVESAHGAKLFYVWASDGDAYLRDRAIAPGFAVVKEAFRAVEVADWEGRMGLGPLAVARGKRWKAGPPAGLFVMAKVRDRDGTDGGWVYGTVVGGTVTSAGRVSTCASCHEDATHERLFGLQPS